MSRISMKVMKGLLQVLMLCVLLSVGTLPAAAQSSTEGPGFDDNVTDVPVDGGITLLLAAGAALGARRLRRKDPMKD